MNGYDVFAKGHAAPSMTLTPQIVTDRILKENLSVKAMSQDEIISSHAITIVKSKFDTMLSGSVWHQMDNSQKTSPLFGSRTDNTAWSLSASKQLIYGTSLGVSFSSLRQRVYDANVNGMALSPDNAIYEPGLEFSIVQPLLNNGFGYMDRRNIQSVKKNHQSNQLEITYEKQRMRYNALKLYWQLYFLSRHIEVQEKAIVFANEFLHTMTRKYNLGAEEKTDLLNAKVNVSQREQEMLNLKNTQQLLEQKIKHLLTIDYDVHIRISPKQPNKIDIPVFNSSIIANALNQRSDYLSLKEIVAKQNIDIVMAKNSKYPRIDLSTSLALNDIEDSYYKALGGLSHVDWQIGLSVQFPLENTHARAKYKQSKAQQAKALYALKMRENEIENQIKRSVQLLKNNHMLYEERLSFLSMQKNKLALEMKKYRLGRSSAYMIIQYQSDCVLADKLYFDAWSNLLSASLEYKLLSGMMK